MRPRHTFESVVSELIEGLNSGTVVLNQSNSRQFAVRPPLRKAVDRRPDVFVSCSHHDTYADDFFGNVHDSLAKSLSYSRGIREIHNEDEIRSDLENASKRLWLYVGAREVQTTARLVLDKTLLIKPRVHYDIRILVSDSLKHSPELSALRGDIRITRFEMDGWLAFTDNKALCHVPQFRAKGDSNSLLKRLFSALRPAKRHLEDITVQLDSTRDPSSFGQLEASYASLWNSASPRDAG